MSPLYHPGVRHGGMAWGGGSGVSACALPSVCLLLPHQLWELAAQQRFSSDEGTEGKQRTKQKLTPCSPSPGDVYPIPQALLAALEDRKQLTYRYHTPARLGSPSVYRCLSS